ncbi:MAG: mannitol dehydrogenase family protein, partial [Phycisphaerales bacterium]|nr:mannitol dehydrogenase family protein [Phycisphaerales bacterium]
NGDRLKSGVRAFAAKAGLEIGDYLDRSVRFPNTMVDRITPATTEALKADLRKETGWEDQAPVATEEFSEWIIENRFLSSRPNWEGAGARLVSDVTPYELRKLRLLNGPHSLLAYFGQLRGHQFVHEAISDREILRQVRGLMREAGATLPELIRNESPAYCDALITRFSNPALKHSLKQIAMDGTEKLPIRILPVFKHLMSDGRDAPFAKHAVACWVAYAIHQSAQDTALDDPKAAEIVIIGRASGDKREKAKKLLTLLDPAFSGTKSADQIAAEAAQLAAI